MFYYMQRKHEKDSIDYIGISALGGLDITLSHAVRLAADGLSCKVHLFPLKSSLQYYT